MEESVACENADGGGESAEPLPTGRVEGASDEATALKALHALADANAQKLVNCAAIQNISTENTGYLELAILKSELQNLVSDANLHAEAAKERVRESGQWSDQGAYKTLERSLQVGHVSQMLQLPDHPSLDDVALPSPTQESLVAVDADSHRQFLGLAAEQLIHMQLAEEGKRQEDVQHLAPEVEERLQATVSALTDAVAAPLGAATASAPTRGRTPLASLAAQAISAAQQQESREEMLREQLRQANSDLLCTLQRVLQLLERLISHHLLKVQAEADAVQMQYVCSHCRALHAKLHALDRELKKESYTRENVDALAQIHALLTKTLGQTREVHEQLRLQLQQYQDAGAELKDIAAEYRTVQAELQQANADLRTFREIEQEI